MALDFYYEEYYVSKTANKSGINNTPGVDANLGPEFSEATIKSNLQKLHNNVISPLRTAFPPATNSGAKDIWITSAFRSKSLNEHPSVKGVENSQHRYGYAVDVFSLSSPTSLVWNWCYQNLPQWGQLIWEYPEYGSWQAGIKQISWVHISYVEGENKNNTSIATKREDLHEMYKSENTTRKGDYTHGIKIADENLL